MILIISCYQVVIVGYLIDGSARDNGNINTFSNGIITAFRCAIEMPLNSFIIQTCIAFISDVNCGAIPGVYTQEFGMCPLTQWGGDKMAAISQTIFSNALSWIKMFEFRLKFHWSLFLRVQLTIFIYLNQLWLDCRRIYASLGLNQLTYSVYHFYEL